MYYKMGLKGVGLDKKKPLHLKRYRVLKETYYAFFVFFLTVNILYQLSARKRH